MQDDIKQLLEVQKIDLEIDKLIKSKKEYPNQMETLKKENEDTEKNLESIKASIIEKDLNKNTLESEINSEKEVLHAKEKRLLETKTNKEYNAVQSEIEKAKERIDALETEELELMNQLEALNPQKETIEQSIEGLVKTNTEKIKEIKSKFDAIESDIAKLEKQKADRLKDVNPRAMNVYNRLRKGKSGLAIASVDTIRHSCRGCYKQLPPQKILEVRRGDKLLFCEGCGRILAWDCAEEQENMQV